MFAKAWAAFDGLASRVVVVTGKPSVRLASSAARSCRQHRTSGTRNFFPTTIGLPLKVRTVFQTAGHKQSGLEVISLDVTMTSSCNCRLTVYRFRQGTQADRLWDHSPVQEVFAAPRHREAGTAVSFIEDGDAATTTAGLDGERLRPIVVGAVGIA